MPGFDGTGPLGAGPMTGGGRGFCAIPLSSWRPFWRGRFFFGGRGRGWRNWYWATGVPGWWRAAYGYPAFGGWGWSYSGEVSSQEEISFLRAEAESLKRELEEIQRRIVTLEKAQGQQSE